MINRTWFRYVGLTMAITLVSCGTAGSEQEEGLSEGQRRLLATHQQKSWTENSEAAAQKNHPILAALRHSRARVRPWIEDHGERADQEKQEKSAIPLAASTLATNDDEIALRLRGLPLDEVIDMLSERIGLNVLVPAGLHHPVTVNFPKMSARRALDVILNEYGYELVARGAAFGIAQRSTLPGLMTRSFHVQNGVALDTKAIDALLTKGRGTLHVDGEGTTIVVTDEESVLEHIADYIDLVDRRPPQVLIEAVIMEIQHGDDSLWSTGTSLTNIDIGDVSAGFTSNFLPAPPGLPFNFGVLANEQDFLFQLAANEHISRTNVLSNPLLATVSGKKAILEVIERVPFVNSSNEVDSGSGGVTQSFQEVEFEEVGIKLEVTPVVGRDGIVEMIVTPEVLELVDFLFNTPVIDRRKVSTTVYVQNNQTLIIGGLLREGRIKTEDKVPLLGDIPILGNLFRSESDKAEKVELLVFLTPHVISAGSTTVEGFQAEQHYLNDENRFPEIKKRRCRKDAGTPPAEGDR